MKCDVVDSASKGSIVYMGEEETVDMNIDINEEDDMLRYKQMHLTLFHAMTDAIEILKEGQRSAETIYMYVRDDEEADDNDDGD